MTQRKPDSAAPTGEPALARHVLEPIFERDFAEHSYGFRPGRGCREAVGRVEELLGEGRVWCVDVDLKSYFDTRPHEGLMALVRYADDFVVLCRTKEEADAVLAFLREWTTGAGCLERVETAQRSDRGLVSAFLCG